MGGGGRNGVRGGGESDTVPCNRIQTTCLGLRPRRKCRTCAKLVKEQQPGSLLDDCLWGGLRREMQDLTLSQPGSRKLRAQQKAKQPKMA